MVIPKHKRPSILADIPKTKKIPVASREDFGRLNPAWRVNLLEMCDPFGWHRVDGQTLQYIRGKLSLYESMTMNEIFVRDKKYNHAVSVNKLCPEARRRLRDLRLDDLEEVHRLRLSGAERVWGIRDLNALILLWWDPKHEICPSDEN